MLVPTPFALFHNTLTLYHGVAFNPDDIGVINIPVTDGVSHNGFVKVAEYRNGEFRTIGSRIPKWVTELQNHLNGSTSF